MREHAPIVIDKFNGLYDRGCIEDVPLDHFTECKNLRFFGDNNIGTRYGIGKHQTLAAPTSGILRIYNYPTQTQSTLLVLTTGGKIYHVVDASTVYGPVLTISNMTDFGFTSYAGRAYITPFTTEVAGELNRERGLQNEYVYVYKGDGTAARKAAGAGPISALTVANSGSGGYTDAGTHVFGYVFETDTGYLSPPGGLVSFNTVANQSLNFSGVAVSSNPAVTKRHIVASKVIQNFNGNTSGYPLYFIPGATIPNNTGTTLSGISFYDQSLLLDASHLFDNFTDIPAGVGLTTYHNRMVVYCTYSNISVAYVSAPGEPEAINQVTGVLLFPPDGNPLTNAAELRDVLYLFQRNKTGAFVDNGGEPTTWPFTMVDTAMGCGVHGIGSVLDSRTSNVDYLLVGCYKGLTLFNGKYILPELTWKIQNFWQAQDFKSNFRRIQIVNDSVNNLLYIVLPDRTVLFGNYANGLDPRNIRWCPWTFGDTVTPYVNSLALWNVSELILGIDQV